jgi:hypothetical protein
MSRTALTVQSLAVAGLNPITYVEPHATGTGNGNSYANDERTVLLIKNPTGGTIVATVVANGAKFKGITPASITVTVLTLKDAVVWVPREFFNDSSGNVLVDFDVVTGVLIAAIQMPAQFA